MDPGLSLLEAAAQSWGARESQSQCALPCSSPGSCLHSYKNHRLRFSLALSSPVQDLAQGIILRIEAGTIRPSNTPESIDDERVGQLACGEI